MGTSICNICGLPIDFKRLSSGKWAPVNLDGTSHFVLCEVKSRSLQKDRPQTQYYGRSVDGIMIEDGNNQPINTPEAIEVRKKYQIDEGTYGEKEYQEQEHEEDSSSQSHSTGT